MLSDGVLISVLTKCGEWVVYPELCTQHTTIKSFRTLSGYLAALQPPHECVMPELCFA